MFARGLFLFFPFPLQIWLWVDLLVVKMTVTRMKMMQKLDVETKKMLCSNFWTLWEREYIYYCDAFIKDLAIVHSILTSLRLHQSQLPEGELQVAMKPMNAWTILVTSQNMNW